MNIIRLTASGCLAFARALMAGVGMWKCDGNKVRLSLSVLISAAAPKAAPHGPMISSHVREQASSSGLLSFPQERWR
jgi:hypothetical protein